MVCGPAAARRARGWPGRRGLGRPRARGAAGKRRRVEGLAGDSPRRAVLARGALLARGARCAAGVLEMRNSGCRYLQHPHAEDSPAVRCRALCGLPPPRRPRTSPRRIRRAAAAVLFAGAARHRVLSALSPSQESESRAGVTGPSHGSESRARVSGYAQVVVRGCGCGGARPCLRMAVSGQATGCHPGSRVPPRAAGAPRPTRRRRGEADTTRRRTCAPPHPQSAGAGYEAHQLSAAGGHGVGDGVDARRDPRGAQADRVSGGGSEAARQSRLPGHPPPALRWCAACPLALAGSAPPGTS